ncbi:NAD(P)H-hydrate epimerase [Aliifodinibius salipaludis]|uniref:Bifunctional NAD(P)H-hydrate repair enzyme n=1 Tax=Fodinibius salipaludis TaxID=2032627 RepID=A0A2A2G9V6_9BACT|nr:NAD(P)H-hydrate dehydratase [Aliifodinibius salipaludis]PAU94371.1 NAD(P)H-hydrate epimerase [Aliifodinibius salipaludis]
MVKETLDAPYSHYLFDAELSQKIDRRTIQEMEIDGFTLMEIAGSSAAKALLEDEELTHGVYLCGKGNNAGDALVVGRYLLQHHVDATIVFLSGSDDLSADTQKNLELLKKFDSDDKLTIFEEWGPFNPPEEFDFIIDGMLGTGLTSDVRGDYTKAVEWANRQPQPVFAMDIPTGLHADSGEIMECAIEANTTFTFGGRKLGLYLKDGPEKTGTIHYCELPFPNRFKEDCNTYLLDESWIQMTSPTPGQHKYNSGVLYIIAGSEGLTGAAIMAAKSAWAEGLGAVILICPRGVLSIYEQTLPSIIKKPVGSRNDFHFKDEHSGKVLEILSEKEGALLLGPGLGREQSTVQFVKGTLSQNNKPTVIDADGLWCLAQLEHLPKVNESEWILTPHPGELNRLVPNSELQKDSRLQTVREYAQTTGVTVLAKGLPGIIGTPAGKCYLTNYNTKYFSRAGSGDVLAGKVGAYLAFGQRPDTSCAYGLLKGKQKLEYYLQHHQDLPEPSDFI